MNKLMTILALSLMTGAAFAEPFPEGTIGIYSVAGRVVSTTALCPVGATCITNGTIVELSLPAHGCMDNLISPIYTQIDRQTVVVHAQILANEASRRTRCIVQPTFVSNLQLIMMFKPFTIKFLGTNESVVVD